MIKVKEFQQYSFQLYIHIQMTINQYHEFFYIIYNNLIIIKQFTHNKEFQSYFRTRQLDSLFKQKLISQNNISILFKYYNFCLLNRLFLQLVKNQILVEQLIQQL
ncbi:hypothetical protein pb186bvf_016642 [Paramecium bursaria]